MKLSFVKGARLASTFALAGAVSVLGVASVASATTKHKKKTPVKAQVFRVETPSKASLTEAGSSLLYPLWNLWAPAYQGKYPQVSLTTGAGGSGLGISEATSNTINIGSSDAYLSPTQVSATPTLMNIPLVISSQVVAYNIPGVNAHLNLSAKVIAQIYEGQITNWNDPAIAAANSKINLPNLPIVPLYRSDGSGDTFLFTQYLSKQDPSGWGASVGFGTTVSWPKNASSLGENGNGGMVSGCQQTKGCIAYIGASYLSNILGGGMTYAALMNGKGQYVKWSAKAVAKEAAGFKVFRNKGAVSMINAKTSGGYPIINYEYAIVNSHQSDTNAAKAVRSLLEWAINPKLGNSSSYLSQVNFLPLPTNFAVASLKLIKTIK
ncbi:MAG TPA: phosphate ABC transporter substrate-binding protein PstS [Acidimicrobiales bacterium]|nr:phosphate ABC transporter substrate-binding protein PstS [Acidimicrobiales bacterium]